MAAINDLIAQVQDAELRDKLEQEVNRMNKQKKFHELNDKYRRYVVGKSEKCRKQSV